MLSSGLSQTTWAKLQPALEMPSIPPKPGAVNQEGSISATLILCASATDQTGPVIRSRGLTFSGTPCPQGIAYKKDPTV